MLIPVNSNLSISIVETKEEGTSFMTGIALGKGLEQIDNLTEQAKKNGFWLEYNKFLPDKYNGSFKPANLEELIEYLQEVKKIADNYL